MYKLTIALGYIILYFLLPIPITAQISYTANTHHTDYPYPIGAGANLGVYTGWTDEDLVALIAGDPQKDLEGVHGSAVRTALPEVFLEQWGYTIREEAFDYYQQIGMKGIVAFVGYPSEDHRETTEYCSGEQSNMFKNLYTPIWDNGENGTPVNDTNYYALYLYKTLMVYGDNVSIWEISNEPDLSSSIASYQGPEMLDSWWNRDPTPCELAIKAPIQSYIRMLRVSYEVIKTFQPNDFVAVGGIGSFGFLDALLRNTDNPDQGLQTNTYPLKGGAYFDVLSFHTYPHIDGSTREWSNAIMNFVYYRHSDRAVDYGYIGSYKKHKQLLDSYHYDGETFPKKHFIVTETNIPRKQYGEFIGSDISQRNYTMKVLLKSMQHKIHQVHFFTIAEEGAFFTNEFSFMGLYKKLGSSRYIPTQLTQQGLAFKTTSMVTDGYTYNLKKTIELDLPIDVDGIALKNNQNGYIYALWAKTNLDLNEEASKLFTIKTEQPNNIMAVYKWDYSQTGHIDSIPGNTLHLSSTPRFFKPIGPAQLSFSIQPQIGPNPSNIDFTINYTLFAQAKVSIELYNTKGTKIQTILTKTSQDAGFYTYRVPTELLPSATYYVQIQARKQILTHKIIVQHD